MTDIEIIIVGIILGALIASNILLWISFSSQETSVGLSSLQEFQLETSYEVSATSFSMIRALAKKCGYEILLRSDTPKFSIKKIKKGK